MPYPNEHAAVLGKGPYTRTRRKNDEFGPGIHALYGVRKSDGKSELRSVHFDKDKFTVGKAKKWLKEHDHKVLEFEPAEATETSRGAVVWIKGSHSTGPIELSGVKRYLKDIVRAGNFVNAQAKRAYNITIATLEHWAKTFHTMKENGVRIPIPPTHQAAGDPEKNKGWVEDMYVEDDKLVGVLELHDNEPDRLAGVSDVSIYSPEEFVDGEGNVYEQPIMHVALTPEPLITKLGKFMPVAASRGAELMEIPVYVEKEEMTMDLKKIGEAFGLKEGLTEKDAEKKLIECGTAYVELGKKVETLGKELKMSREKEKEKDKGKEEPAKVDPELVRLSRKYRETELNGLVAAGRITPVVKDKLTALFIGEENGAIIASIQAGKGEDFDKLVTALKENDPVILKERTGPQNLVVLDRGGDQPTRDPDLEKRQERVRGGQ